MLGLVLPEDVRSKLSALCFDDGDDVDLITFDDEIVFPGKFEEVLIYAK